MCDIQPSMTGRPHPNSLLKYMSDIQTAMTGWGLGNMLQPDLLTGGGRANTLGAIEKDSSSVNLHIVATTNLVSSQRCCDAGFSAVKALFGDKARAYDIG